MKDIIIDSVGRLEEIMHHSGCEEGGVRLDVNPDAKNCQYERGACMIATFGGRTAEFVTDDPIRALTKISFMAGAPLDTPATRSAACAVINVAAGFFCLSRVLHACPVASHAPCKNELVAELSGNRIFCTGKLPALEAELRNPIASRPEDADIILINNEGIILPEAGDLIESFKATKRIIWLGPSTAGVARIQQQSHWCPYGT
jgi:hypothetical protein